MRKEVKPLIEASRSMVAGREFGGEFDGWTSLHSCSAVD
jgi:hypothetical protein